MKDFIDAIRFIAWILIALLAMLYVFGFVIKNSSNEEVTFHENKTVACVKYRPAGSWELTVDECVKLSSQSAIQK